MISGGDTKITQFMGIDSNWVGEGCVHAYARLLWVECSAGNIFPMR